MKLITELAAMQAEVTAVRCRGSRLALVPTMGSLHEGHMELVRRARDHADHVTVSIFVNPTQFAPGEDYERYPRSLESDLERLSGIRGVEAVYAPSSAAMYSEGVTGLTWVSVDRLAEYLCGPFRKGHFRGVTTVVAKLFNACRPDVAVFGLKDAQQFFILDRMARELDYGIELVGVETVREPDGLAMSSRNQYLNGEARRQAHVLSQAVFAARDMILSGAKTADVVLEAMRQPLLAAPMVRMQYVQVVDVEFLQPVEKLTPGSTVVAALAAHIGGARLIDNAIVKVPD